MDLELQAARRDLAILRRTLKDLDALKLPGEYDLQQAAVLTVSQLCTRAHKRVEALEATQKGVAV